MRDPMDFFYFYARLQSGAFPASLVCSRQYKKTKYAEIPELRMAEKPQNFVSKKKELAEIRLNKFQKLDFGVLWSSQ